MVKKAAMSKRTGPQNLRISSRAWELLRWAKYELGTKSYTETITALSAVSQLIAILTKKHKMINEGKIEL